MKKQLIYLSLLCFALTGMAQTNPINNPLPITKGQATIDGKNSTNYTYVYTGKDSAWAATFVNIPDNENIRIMYSKTTASDCIVTFPAGSVISQPSMPGVAINGLKMTLSSSANGSFMFIIIRAGSSYNVQVTRLAP